MDSTYPTAGRQTSQATGKGASNVKTPVRTVLATEVEYMRLGLLAFGDMIRRIADALLGRPAAAPVPVPVPVRTGSRH
jgi:hypothetical protein